MPPGNSEDSTEMGQAKMEHEAEVLKDLNVKALQSSTTPLHLLQLPPVIQPNTPTYLVMGYTACLSPSCNSINVAANILLFIKCIPTGFEMIPVESTSLFVIVSQLMLSQLDPTCNFNLYYCAPCPIYALLIMHRTLHCFSAAYKRNMCMYRVIALPVAGHKRALCIQLLHVGCCCKAEASPLQV